MGFGIMPILFRNPIYVHKRRRLSSEIAVLVEAPPGSVQRAQNGAIHHFFLDLQTRLSDGVGGNARRQICQGRKGHRGAGVSSPVPWRPALT